MSDSAKGLVMFSALGALFFGLWLGVCPGFAAFFTLLVLGSRGD